MSEELHAYEKEQRSILLATSYTPVPALQAR